jgi:hypothetical protein
MMITLVASLQVALDLEPARLADDVAAPVHYCNCLSKNALISG